MTNDLLTFFTRLPTAPVSVGSDVQYTYINTPSTLYSNNLGTIFVDPTGKPYTHLFDSAINHAQQINAPMP